MKQLRLPFFFELDSIFKNTAKLMHALGGFELMQFFFNCFSSLWDLCIVMENADSDDRLGQEIVYIYIYAMCLENWKKKRIDSLVFPPQKLVTAFTIHIYTFLASADLANVKKYGNSRSVFYAWWIELIDIFPFWSMRWLRDVNYSERWSNDGSSYAIYRIDFVFQIHAKKFNGQIKSSSSYRNVWIR